MHFRKAALKVGTYHSPDGTVIVTPERLRHWQENFSRVKNAGYVVPIDWDHADDADGLLPLSAGEFDKRRSAKNTVGKLVGFVLNAAGDGAELTLEVSDPTAEGRAQRNEVFVSPVIAPHWRDGANNDYRDVLTHVDFVNHPVDYSQGPFSKVEPGTIACALRMSTWPGVYRMAAVNHKRPKKTPHAAASSAADQAATAAAADNAAADDNTADNTADYHAASDVASDDPKLAEVIQALGKMSIVLSADTTAENFLDHLHQAVLTRAAQEGETLDDDSTSPITVADPGYAAMSLQARAALAYAERTQRQEVERRLQTLLESGRCTPHEAAQQKRTLGAIKLSLNSRGEPVASDAEKWLASREAVPQGTFWDAQTRITRMASPAPRPAGTREPTPEEDQKIVDFVLGKRA